MAERDELVGVETLVAEEDDLVVEKGPPHLGHFDVGESGREVDPRHDRPARPGDPVHRDVGVRAARRRRRHRDQDGVDRRHSDIVWKNALD